MKGVHNDDGHDDASANSLPHRRDTHPDLSKTPELYCGDLFDYCGHCRVASLTLVDCSSEIAGRGKSEEELLFSSYPGERRCAVKLPAIHQPLLSLIAGILILIVPGLLNLIVAVYLIVVGLLGLMRR